MEDTAGTMFASLCQICGTKLCLACLKMGSWNSRCVDEAKACIWRHMERTACSRHGLNIILLEAATCLQASGILLISPNPFWSWKLLNSHRMFGNLPGPDEGPLLWSCPIKELFCERSFTMKCHLVLLPFSSSLDLAVNAGKIVLKPVCVFWVSLTYKSLSVF